MTRLASFVSPAILDETAGNPQVTVRICNDHGAHDTSYIANSVGTLREQFSAKMRGFLDYGDNLIESENEPKE